MTLYYAGVNRWQAISSTVQPTAAKSRTSIGSIFLRGFSNIGLPFKGAVFHLAGGNSAEGIFGIIYGGARPWPPVDQLDAYCLALGVVVPIPPVLRQACR